MGISRSYGRQRCKIADRGGIKVDNLLPFKELAPQPAYYPLLIVALHRRFFFATNELASRAYRAFIRNSPSVPDSFCRTGIVETIRVLGTIPFHRPYHNFLRSRDYRYTILLPTSSPGVYHPDQSTQYPPNHLERRSLICIRGLTRVTQKRRTTGVGLIKRSTRPRDQLLSIFLLNLAPLTPLSVRRSEASVTSRRAFGPRSPTEIYTVANFTESPLPGASTKRSRARFI